MDSTEYPKMVLGWPVADAETEAALLNNEVTPPVIGSVHYPMAANPQQPVLTLAMCTPKDKPTGEEAEPIDG